VILRAVEQNTYHLIIIDSIGNALANAEQENESVHDKTYGGTSAPNTTFLKKLTNMLTMETDWGDVRDPCIIGINQVRDNIKDPNAPYKAPGGNALKPSTPRLGGSSSSFHTERK
jgi:RecA/RadA recombinase